MDKTAIFKHCEPITIGGKTFLNIRGDFSSFMDKIESIYKDPSRVSEKIRQTREGSDWSDWPAIGNQTRDNVFETRVFNAAVEAYQKAKAKIDAQLVPGKMEYSPVGASFSMGKFLNGHPVCAFRREKTKLPTKTINLLIRARASVDSSALSAPLVRIAKAASEYQAAGGIVTLTAGFLNMFSSPLMHNGDKIEGMTYTIKVPLTNAGILASAASVQMYRGLILPISVWASPDAPDSLPMARMDVPGYHWLDGTPGATAAVLKALAIV